MKKLFLSLMLLIATSTLAFAEKAQITINGIVCDFCARALEKTFSKQEEVEKINVNLDTGIVIVNFINGKTLDDESLKQTVLDAGYNIETITRIKDAE
ncbi:MAG: copper chaperone CopZ [Alphaproteobacteria bacterium]|jgi:copper chaperone CopZ